MKVLAEVIGGATKVLTIGGNPSIPELAALAADSSDRHLTDEQGQELNWILYVPNGKGGFAPASRGDGFDDIEAHQEDRGGSGTFAGPGQAEGEDYAFRIRLFLPSPRPPEPPTETGPIPIDDDEDVIDLTNIDADSGDLVGVRRVRKKRRRKKQDEATDPGRPRRKRPSGTHRTIEAEGSGTVSGIGPVAAAEEVKPSEEGRISIPGSDAEMTFSEGVAFSNDGTFVDAAVELTIGDGTLGPAAQNSAIAEAHSHVASPDGDTEDAEETLTAVAVRAVIDPTPTAEAADSTSGEEEVAIGSASIDHEDVELSIPPDTFPLGVQAPREPAEEDNDESPTQLQVAKLPAGFGEEADQGPALPAEPDDEAADAPTIPDRTLDPEALATAIAGPAVAPPPEATAPTKRRRKRKKRPPPPAKKRIVAAVFALAAACVGLVCLLHSRGVI